jgi:hypothetical protein
MLRWGRGANSRGSQGPNGRPEVSPVSSDVLATDGTGSPGEPGDRDDDAIEVGYSPLADEYGGTPTG